MTNGIVWHTSPSGYVHYASDSIPDEPGMRHIYVSVRHGDTWADAVVTHTVAEKYVIHPHWPSTASDILGHLHGPRVAKRYTGSVRPDKPEKGKPYKAVNRLCAACESDATALVVDTAGHVLCEACCADDVVSAAVCASNGGTWLTPREWCMQAAGDPVADELWARCVESARIAAARELPTREYRALIAHLDDIGSRV